MRKRNKDKAGKADGVYSARCKVDFVVTVRAPDLRAAKSGMLDAIGELCGYHCGEPIGPAVVTWLGSEVEGQTEVKPNGD
jgi:hypothetical protein